MAIDKLDSSSPANGVEQKRGQNFRTLAIGGFILLLIGVVGGGWAMNRLLDSRETAAPVTKTTSQATPSAEEAPRPDADGDVAPLMVAPVDGADALVTRVAELEQRLSRITLEAESASGNASRAEGLLVAFAVRRALDRGLSLGYLEAQLRLRFGDDQPNAVKTIIDTSREPVTLEQLRTDLDTLAPQLVGRSNEGEGSLWTGIRREFNELFVVRKAGTQSTRASERLARARRYLAGEQVDKAIAEVEAMPGAATAQDWLIEARRYHEARRALDLIETAAILEPRDGSATATGTASAL
ncbi:mitofilin family membrane protein [Sphingopyxis sp. MWB1]|uniref:mitofilin family membrane protein n=1 Tax=Sphingopyxis sp. MWB1 TaxID=1537715 RepID=UPI00051A0662|nr:mitofilin family membrane protein [Sphingopyxis sp. MWB1]